LLYVHSAAACLSCDCAHAVALVQLCRARQVAAALPRCAPIRPCCSPRLGLCPRDLRCHLAAAHADLRGEAYVPPPLMTRTLGFHAGRSACRRRVCSLSCSCTCRVADRSPWLQGAPPPPPSAARDEGVDPRTAFRYVFVGGVSPAAHGFSLLILRDALEPAGVELYAPAPEASSSPWSLSCSLRELERVTPDDGRPLRLIGASTGALVAALFAERHPDRVDSLFLLSPTFNLRACLERAVGGERGLAVWRSQARPPCPYALVRCALMPPAGRCKVGRARH